MKILSLPRGKFSLIKLAINQASRCQFRFVFKQKQGCQLKCVPTKYTIIFTTYIDIIIKVKDDIKLIQQQKKENGFFNGFSEPIFFFFDKIVCKY